jgi:hypothetical protein
MCNFSSEETADLCTVKINSQINIMNMKNLTRCIVALSLLLSLFSIPSNAATSPGNTLLTTNTAVVVADSTTSMTRLNEINAMDKSAMSFSEKKQLRKEVRAIKSLNGGVYLSAGAIIIIVLLLILLL